MQGEMTGTTRDVVVHTYASPGLGSVNTFWVESPSAIVDIDGQRLLSQARIVLDQIAKTRKKVEAIIMTHIHPDHIGGTGAIAAAFPGARVLASQAATDGIRTDPGGLLALAKQWLGDDFQVAAPTDVLVADRALAIDGMTFDVRETGPGEAFAMTVLYLREARALFAADVVCNAMTPFLAEQRTGLWLTQLEWIATAFPDVRMAYPGHGVPADMQALVSQTREYLTKVRSLVKARQAGGAQLTPAVRAELIAAIERIYPGYVPVAAIPDALGLNVDGVWAEMQREPR